MEDDIPVIHVFSRDKDGKRIYKRVTNFEPYFYVLEDDPIAHELIVRTESTNLKTMAGLRVKKIFTKIPKDVPKVRDLCAQTFEADVLFPTRYTVDTFDEIPQVPLRVMYLDIETDYTSESPNVNSPNQPIICLSVYDNFLDKTFTFIWRKDFVNNSKEEITFGNTKVHVLYFNNERDMHMKFLKYVNDTDPDIITGWFVIDFDMAYLINRMSIMGIDFTQFSPLGTAFIKRKDVIVKGRILFDMLKAYKRRTFSQLPSYKLDNVAEKEIGEKKVSLGKKIGIVWRTDFKKLIHYNVKDVLLVKRINDKKKLIEDFDELRRLSKCAFDDTFFNSKIIDAYILHYCKNKMVLPTKSHGEDKETIGGGFVLKPQEGVHDFVGVFDFKALYPKIISNFNLSPDTITDEEGKDIIKFRIPEIDYSKLKKKDWGRAKDALSEYFEEEWNFIKQDFNNPSSNPFLIESLRWREARFKQDKKGFLPIILEEIFETRMKVQKERDTYPKEHPEYVRLDNKQYALKTFMNSFYGVLALVVFRLYTIEIAASITFIGRQSILWNKRVTKEQGYDTIYGDTDSTFVKIPPSNDINKLLERCEEIRTMLMNSYSVFIKHLGKSEHSLILEFEKLFRKALFGHVKKRYAGLLMWEKGKVSNELSISGFESKRANYSKLARTTQREIFERILKLGQSKEEVISFIKSITRNIRDGKYDPETIALPAPLSKPIDEYKSNTPVIRAVIYSNRHLGMNIKPGDRFFLLYVTHVPNKPPTDVIAFDGNENIPPGTVIDINRMVEKTIVVDAIFEALGWNMMELQQKSLLSW